MGFARFSDTGELEVSNFSAKKVRFHNWDYVQSVVKVILLMPVDRVLGVIVS